ncbi:4'-phosphopantetheinyl transferase family protein [Cohnella boryungensis]|uniref:4'-phosphopantetheinyl transferase family protein n=1 Tax=Cohnella boryungensis TaxID=768479 RepID=A0ABV8S9R6_9BACL
MLELIAVYCDRHIDAEQFRRLLELADEAKRARIRKFRRREDAQRLLVADLMVRDLAKRRLRIRNREIRFSRNACGKPFVQNSPRFRYNVSHSGDWVVCVCDEEEVGIDVELVRPIDVKLAERFFHPTEYKQIIEKEGRERWEAFFKLWTLKESYVKAIGTGLRQPLSAFSFELRDDRPEFRSDMLPRHFHFKLYDWAPDYKLAVCAAKKIASQSLTVIGVKTFCDEVCERLAD